METVAFWREREAGFLALPRPTDEMYACWLGGIDAARRRTDHSSSVLVLAIRNPEYPIDALYALARRTFGMAAILIDGGYVPEWIVGGGPAVKYVYKILHDGFRREAVIASVGADAVGRDATDQEAVDQWLHLLRRAGSPYYRGEAFPWIDNLPAASAAMCAWFATRAYQDHGPMPGSANAVPGTRTHTSAISIINVVFPSLAPTTAPSGEPTNRPDAPATESAASTAKNAFPHRAAWLQRMLERRKWTVHDVDEWGGPSWKSVRKILRGKAVNQSVLEKLVGTLSKKGSVSIADIPDD